jgi:hypothetical protein
MSGGELLGSGFGACHGVCKFWKMRFDLLLDDLLRVGWFVVQEKGLNETATLIYTSLVADGTIRNAWSDAQ